MQLFIKKRTWKKTEARGQVITLKQTGDTTVRFTALTVSIKTCSGGSKELVWHSGFLKQIGHFKMIYKSNLRSLEVQKSTLHVKDHHGQDLSFSFGCSF